LSLLRFALYEIVNCLVWAGLIGGVAYLLGGLPTEIFMAGSGGSGCSRARAWSCWCCASSIACWNESRH